MAKTKNYEYDYQNGIASQREKAFRQVMKTQSEYEFLNHNNIPNRKSEEKQKLIEKINQRIEKLKTKALLFLMLIGIGLMSMSCEKDTTIPVEQKVLITQELKLTNIYAMPMTKGFDPSTWVYEYNTTPAVITFTNVNNPAETVTQSVTIAQLQQGISLSIFAGTYNITYETTHTSTTTLDIKIDMPNTVINGTPINLTATYADFLIIVDVACDGTPTIVDDGGYAVETFNAFNGFYYAYFNAKRTQSSDNLYVSFYTTSQKKFIMTTFAFGNIYWYTSPIGAGTTITFPEWIINKITI